MITFIFTFLMHVLLLLLIIIMQNTPLAMACIGRSTEIVGLLLKHDGVDINHLNSQGVREIEIIIILLLLLITLVIIMLAYITCFDLYSRTRRHS